MVSGAGEPRSAAPTILESADWQLPRLQACATRLNSKQCSAFCCVSTQLTSAPTAAHALPSYCTPGVHAYMGAHQLRSAGAADAVRALQLGTSPCATFATTTASRRCCTQWNPSIGPVSEASDVWCASATLCHLASGREPFAGLQLFQIMFAVASEGRRPDVPPSVREPLASAMRRAFAAEQAGRPTAQEMLDAARATLEAASLVMCDMHGDMVQVSEAVGCAEAAAQRTTCAGSAWETTFEARGSSSERRSGGTEAT